ncbi:MAG: hypothetical protein HY720_32870, partial [Planctomycetes bacterium]|nr:hypothetical protein [Planctomycetota bacterium]
MSEEKRYRCSCGKKMIIPAEMAGKQLKCPKCGKRVAPSPALADSREDLPEPPGDDEDDLEEEVEEEEEEEKEAEEEVPAKKAGTKKTAPIPSGRLGRPGAARSPARKEDDESPDDSEDSAEDPPKPPKTLDVIRGKAKIGQDGDEESEEEKPPSRLASGRKKSETGRWAKAPAEGDEDAKPAERRGATPDKAEPSRQSTRRGLTPRSSA